MIGNIQAVWNASLNGKAPQSKGFLKVAVARYTFYNVGECVKCKMQHRPPSDDHVPTNTVEVFQTLNILEPIDA